MNLHDDSAKFWFNLTRSFNSCSIYKNCLTKYRLHLKISKQKKIPRISKVSEEKEKSHVEDKHRELVHDFLSLISSLHRAELAFYMRPCLADLDQDNMWYTPSICFLKM